MKEANRESSEKERRVEQPNIPGKKVPPSAVVGLRNEQVFASASEVELLEAQRRQEAARQRATQTAFDEANKPPLIALPFDLLEKLRRLLGLPNNDGADVVQECVDKAASKVEAVVRRPEVLNPLACYGITDRLHELAKKVPSIFAGSESPTVLPIHTLSVLQAAHLNLQGSVLAYSNQDVEDEIVSLTAIYGDQFSYELIQDEVRRLSIVVSSDDTSTALELFIRPREFGEVTLPLIRVEKTVYYEQDVVEILKLQLQVWVFFATLRHVPCMFDLLMFIQERRDLEDIDPEAVLMNSLTSEQGLTETLPSTPLTEIEEGIAHIGGLVTKDKSKLRGAPRKIGSFWDRTIVSITQSKSLLGNPSLPAYQAKQDFLDLLDQHPAMVVTGETGSGKTTQIPQFILEAYPTSKVVICQPRRIAATSVATRVADELNSKVGGTVGYMVRGDSKVSEIGFYTRIIGYTLILQVSEKTQILFCTFGVMLRRMQDDPDLGGFKIDICVNSCIIMILGIDFIILDEVHERGMDSDFAFAMILLAMRRRNTYKNTRDPLKLIIMSATIAVDKFADYIGSKVMSGGKAPVLSIPGYTFPVADFYRNQYEDIVRLSIISTFIIIAFLNTI